MREEVMSVMKFVLGPEEMVGWGAQFSQRAGDGGDANEARGEKG